MEISRVILMLLAIVCVLVIGGVGQVYSMDGQLDTKAELVDGTAIKSELEFTDNVNLPLINIEIKGKEYKFLLDTGSTFTVIDKNLVKELEQIGSLDNEDAAEQKKAQGPMVAKLDSFKLGDIEFENVGVRILNLSHFREYGLNIKGIVGANILQFLELTIDYQNEKILFSQESQFNFSREKGYKLQLAPESKWSDAKLDRPNRPTIEVVFGGATVPTLVDTGYSGFVSIESALVHQNEKMFKKVLVKELKGGSTIGVHGQKSLTLFGKDEMGGGLFKFPAIQIGEMKFKDFPVDLVSGDGTMVIGSDFLNEFEKVVINYLEKEIFFIGDRKNIDKTQSSCGFKVGKNEVGEVIVNGYWKGSPAEKANLEIGDKILKATGKGAQEVILTNFSLVELGNKLLLNEEYEVLELLIEKKTGEKRKVTLEKENLMDSDNGEY